MVKKFNQRQQNVGLLVLRIGIGIMFMYHGWGKITGGTEMWSAVGAAVSHVGIAGGHTFFGFLASLSEFGGGLLLILGLFFRTACIFLCGTMVVAAALHLGQGDGFGIASHAIEAAILFFSLIFIGPGAYSLGGLITRRT